MKYEEQTVNPVQHSVMKSTDSAEDYHNLIMSDYNKVVSENLKLK